jgi:hypothetical protein
MKQATPIIVTKYSRGGKPLVQGKRRSLKAARRFLNEIGRKA